MSELRAYGITVELPPGWEGEVYQRRAVVPAPSSDPRAQALAQVVAEETHHPVTHIANFPLPPKRGDYGSGAVEVMTPADVLVVLFEFHPDSAGTGVFAAEGMPRSVRPSHFDPAILQRGIKGQAGVQRFFTEAGRAFCLYVVLGSYQERRKLVPAVNRILAGITID